MRKPIPKKSSQRTAVARRALTKDAMRKVKGGRKAGEKPLDY
jgi:hypothetical protein